MTVASKCGTTLVLALSFGAGAAHTQTTQWQPPTDTSAQASPTTPAAKAPATDSSAQASPVGAGKRQTGPVLAPHTAVPVTLDEGIDSGHLKNGQTVHGRLSSDVPARNGTLRSGTPVQLSVIGTVPAGRLNAVGEMSLQLEQIGKVPVNTEVLTFRGKPGHKDLPDSAPALGTNAGLASGAALTFHIAPQPVFADNAPAPDKATPGSVNGVAAGETPQQQPASNRPAAPAAQGSGPSPH